MEYSDKTAPQQNKEATKPGPEVDISTPTIACSKETRHKHKLQRKNEENVIKLLKHSSLGKEMCTKMYLTSKQKNHERSGKL